MTPVDTTTARPMQSFGIALACALILLQAAAPATPYPSSRSEGRTISYLFAFLQQQ